MHPIRILLFAIFVLHGLSAFARVENTSYQHVKDPTRELHGFALAVQDYLNSGHRNYFRKRVDYRYFANAAVEGMKNVPDLNEVKNYSEFENMIRELISNMSEGIFSEQADWTYLNHRKYENRDYLMYRVGIDENWDYVELLVKPGIRDWLILDWYIYGTELWASEAMGFIFGNIYKTAVEGKSSPVADFIHALQEDPKAMEEAFHKLSDEEKRIPFLLSLYLTHAASANNEEMFISALEEVERIVGGKSHNLSLIRLYQHRLQHRKTISAVEKLQLAIGPDIYFDFLLAESWAALGEKGKSINYVLATLKNQPDDLFTYYTTLIFLVGQNMYREAVMLLEVLHEVNESYTSREVLENIEGLASFVDSSEYKSWQEQNINQSL